MEKHQALWNKGFFYSELHTTVAGLLGIELHEGDPQYWHCPFPDCEETFHDLHDMSVHTQTVHGNYSNDCFDEIGVFWTLVIEHLTQQEPDKDDKIFWPSLSQIFEGNKQFLDITPFAIDFDRFKELWLSNSLESEQEWVPLEDNPLDHLIKDYFLYVSTEGWNERCQSYYQNLSESLTEKEREEKTERDQKKINDQWTHTQNKMNPDSHQEIYALNQLSTQIRNQQKAEEHRRRIEQTSEEIRQLEELNAMLDAQYSESSRRWLNQQDPETNMDTNSRLSSDNSISNQTELFEHDNNSESDRTPPRTSQWLNTLPIIQEEHEERHITPTTQPPSQLETPSITSETQPSQLLRDRTQELIAIVHASDLTTAEQQLESFLSALAREPIPESDKIPVTLDIPLIYALIQSKAYHIFRKDIFCPIQGCTRKMKTIHALSSHLHSKHYFEHQHCTDIIQFFIGQMFEGQLQTILVWENERNEEEIIPTPLGLERCYFPRCTASQCDHTVLENHVKNAHKAESTINSLGWFWGNMALNIAVNPYITIRDLLNERIIHQCLADNCGKVFSSERGLKTHFTRVHNLGDSIGWQAPSRKLHTRTVICNQHQNQNHDPPNMENIHTDLSQPRTRERRFSPPGGILRAFTDQEAQAEMERIQDMEESEINLRQAYIHKREHFLTLTKTGVNVPPLNQTDKKRLRTPLNDLLSRDINPMLEHLMPKAGDWDSWVAFEGVYEDALDKIRSLIAATKGRNPRRIYGAKVLNPKLQNAREQISETMIKRQAAQVQLRKVKYFLEEIALSNNEEDNQRREPEIARINTRWTQKISPILDKIPEETRKTVFGNDLSHERIWEELNTSPDHREQVIKWLESLIVSELDGELEGMKGQLHTQLVRETYNTAKSIAMKRFVNKKHYTPCAIDKKDIHNHFQKIWATPTQDFSEAAPDSPLFLDPKIPPEAAETMEEFMLNEKNISEVIKSRKDQSSCGPDGISNLILKAAGKEGIRFMKSVIQGCLSYGRIMDSWKMAKTILIYKKGDKIDPKNWRPISITNCLYRVFTCLMARCFQDINATYQLYSDPQKGFIKKTNGCTEHGIVLNELFNDANRHHKGLVITAIDFTNAFGSIPHELILSTMKQRNFPEWTRKIVENMYTDASSYIELRGCKSDPIAWKKGVKQGCPLSPLLFNLCLEPLIQLIKRVNRGSGAFVDIGENKKIENLIQAYADDVALISETPEGIQEMLKSLELFTKWSKMEVNVQKCSTGLRPFSLQFWADKIFPQKVIVVSQKVEIITIFECIGL
jgi:hypothetical protein